MSPERRRVLVVGGGITGLAAAWQAARLGADVTLVEATGRLGGKVRTEHIDGLLIEHGPDSFVAFRPAALQLIDELGMSDEVIGVRGRRSVQIRIDGRLVPLPDGMGMVLPTRIGPFATTRLLTVRQKARAGLDLLLPRRLTDDDTSIGAFLRARLGDGVVERIAEPMVGGIYGAGVDLLSLDAVLPSLRESEREHRSLLVASLAQGRRDRAVRARSRAGAGQASATPFRSLRRGMGSLTDRLVAALADSGAVIRTDAPVLSLRPRDGGGVEAVTGEGSAGQFDAVVLAVGAPALADLLHEGSPAAAEALRAIPQTSSTVVTLALPRSGFATPPSSQGWLEGGPAPISGVTISSAKWAARAPEGTVLLRAFVPERIGPLAEQPDEVVLATALEHVGRVLGFRGEPGLTRVTRWRRTMPTYTVGHLQRVAIVEAALADLPGWHAAGSALHGVGLPECIADGRSAARATLRPAGPTSPDPHRRDAA